MSFKTALENQWDFDKLECWLTRNILSKISGTPPSDVDDGEDLRIWPDNAEGKYTVASAYNMLCDFQDNDNRSSWKQVWKLRREFANLFGWSRMIEFRKIIASPR